MAGSIAHVDLSLLWLDSGLPTEHGVKDMKQISCTHIFTTVLLLHIVSRLSATMVLISRIHMCCCMQGFVKPLRSRPSPRSTGILKSGSQEAFCLDTLYGCR